MKTPYLIGQGPKRYFRFGYIFPMLLLVGIGAIGLNSQAAGEKEEHRNNLLQSRGTTYSTDRILMEYGHSDDINTFHSILTDFLWHWSQSEIDAGSVKRIGLTYGSGSFRPDTGKRALQFCLERNCGRDTSTARNHFDGITSSSHDSFAFGGYVSRVISGTTVDGSVDQTTVWLQRHPQANNLDSDIYELHFRIQEPSTIAVKQSLFFRQVGFKNNRPTVEPIKGAASQLFVAWNDTDRYEPNNKGVVESDNKGRPTSRRLDANQKWTSNSGNVTGYREDNIGWTYRVYWTDNSSLPYELDNWGCNVDNNRDNPRDLDKCWATLGILNSRVDIDNRRYLSTIDTSGFSAGTDLHVRMRVRQYRFAQAYYHYSKTTRIRVPSNLQNIEQNQNAIKLTWVNNYNQDIDRYEYRIGHDESGRQTSFSSWIRACAADVKTETINNEDHQTLEIVSPRGSGNCGPDLTAPLDYTKSYRVQLRAIDDSVTDNPAVRNYVHADLLQLTTPPTTMPPTTMPPTTMETTPPTATTPSTVAPTTPTNPGTTPPPATNPTTPTTQPTPTLIIGTPTTNPTPPATQTPVQPVGPGPINPGATNQPTGGDNINVEVEGDNNTIIIGDSNIIFTDTSESVHEQNIIQLADMGVTRGCNPPTNTRFCPDRAVTRAEMATFLVRAFGLPTTDEDPFTDTDGNIHRSNINRMAAAGISRGCNPPENSRFCPDRAVTRAEMATFMTRVLELEEEGTGFDDTEGNVHATNINRFANAGITRGCNPREGNTRYCPDRAVIRGEMATFLIRSTSLQNS